MNTENKRENTLHLYGFPKILSPLSTHASLTQQLVKLSGPLTPFQICFSHKPT